jgi:uncharacterized OB-fold protein
MSEVQAVEHEWMQPIRALVGKEYGRILAWDAVNAPMIRQWCEMMGVDYAAHKETAPATMLQVWCMEGLVTNNYPPGSTTENPYEALNLIEAQGYPSVVAVNSELSFERELVLGERLYYTTRLDAIGPEKTTGLGSGYFVTLVMSYFSQRADGDEKVGELLFRVFKFKPAHAAKPAPPEAPAPARRPAPGVSDDTRFFWEGVRAGKLLIQRCACCRTLRHPPGPVCSECHSFDWDTVTASGLGTLYSFVVAHYPVVAPFEHPNPVGLIQLDEGTRLVAQLVGVDRATLAIGQRVQVEFHTFDGDLVLPQFRPTGA